MNNRFWRNKNVFVTGCTGLVGSWLSRYLLEEGANVIGLVRDSVPKSILWSKGDGFDPVRERMVRVSGCLTDYNCLERTINEYEIEVVFHLGAQTIVGIANRNPMSTFEANIRGTYNLLEACRRNSKMVKAVLMASSDKAYGDQPKLPYDESTPLQGTHPYDVSKSCADLIAYTYFNSYGTPVVVTRCGNFYGPGDLNFNRIVPQTIRHAVNGERPIIRSDGKNLRDYFFVKDGALAYMFLAEKMYEKNLAGEAYNLSLNQPLSVLDLVRKILVLADRTDLEPIIKNEASNEIKDQYLSSAKARETLGWKPRFSLDEGLKETVTWYKKLLRSA